jgi:acyl carrier protein
MSPSNGPAGPQFRADRPLEQEAVRTTIVGGRPPGSGQPVGDIPRGIEVLVKKAAVDAEFKALLLSRRAAAAEQIGLTLQPAEAMMLAVAPAAQLEAIIARTSVPGEHRRAFLGQAAAVMLAALAAAAPSIAEAQGGRPGEDLPDGGTRPQLPDQGNRSELPEGGIRPTVPEKKTPAAKPKTVEQRVIAVIAKQMKIDEADLALTAKEWLTIDLDATPAGRAAQRKALEKEFQIEIPADAFKKWRNVGDAAHYVQVEVDKRDQAEQLRKLLVPNKDHPMEDSAGGIRPDFPK